MSSAAGAGAAECGSDHSPRSFENVPSASAVLFSDQDAQVADSGGGYHAPPRSAKHAETARRGGDMSMRIDDASRSRS